MALAGESLLERLHAAGAPIESVCRGNGACGTCIVEVEEGAESLSPAAPDECDMVKRRGGNDRCRLSCQAKLLSGTSGAVKLTQPVLRLARAERERAARAFQRVDWDHVESHPIFPEVFQEMGPILAGRYGSPVGEKHFFSTRAHEAIEKARQRAARAVGCAPEQILFLSGWAELALGLRILHGEGPVAGPEALFFPPMEMIVAGREILPWRFGASGVLDTDSFETSLARGASLVFCGSAIAGTGTRLPLARIAEAARRRRIPFGVDLSWSWSLEDIWQELSGAEASFVTLAPSLFGGPRGVIVLVLASGAGWPLPERGVEPALAAGAAAALEIAGAHRAAEGKRLAALRDSVESFWTEKLPGCDPWSRWAADRLPQAACLTFTAWNAEGLSSFLETAGVAVGGTFAGSRTDRVLRALGVDPLYAAGAATIWLGHENTEEEFSLGRDRILAAVKSFRAVVPTARPGLMPGTQAAAPRPATIEGELRAAYMDET